MDQHNGSGIRIIVSKHFHEVRVINFGSLLTNIRQSLSSARFKGHENAAGAVAYVFIMLFLSASWFKGERNNGIIDQLTWPLIKTENRAAWIIWLLVKIQHIFHVPDEIAGYLSYTPASLQPRLKFIFFNSLCTLICEIESTTSISTSLSAKSLTVHLDLPSGGSEQARRVN